MKKKIGIAVEVDLHAKVKSAAPLRGTNVEGAYDEALRTWLGSATESPAQVGIFAPHNQRWHDLLEEVLSDPEERLGIEKNLWWAVQHIRSKNPRPPAGRDASASGHAPKAVAINRGRAR